MAVCTTQTLTSAVRARFELFLSRAAWEKVRPPGWPEKRILVRAFAVLCLYEPGLGHGYGIEFLSVSLIISLTPKEHMCTPHTSTRNSKARPSPSTVSMKDVETQGEREDRDGCLLPPVDTRLLSGPSHPSHAAHRRIHSSLSIHTRFGS